MRKTINLESIYTPYTIDTYQTFNFDNVEEMEIENYNQENNTDFNYDNFDWNYDNKGYLQALADNRLKLLRDNILDNVIIDIKKEGEPISPKYYNYTTDHVFNNYIINMEELEKYINANIDNYNENKIKSVDGFMWLGLKEHTMLNYYLFNESIKKYSPDNYYYDQLEKIEAYEYIDFKLTK